MSSTSTGLSDEERKGASLSGRSAQRHGVLSSQWENRDAFSVEEAGKILGISRASAFAAAKKGEIPTIKIGKRLIVPRRALERLLGVNEADAPVGQLAPQIVAAPPASAPQRVEVAIHVSAAAPRGRSRKGAATAVAEQPQPQQHLQHDPAE